MPTYFMQSNRLGFKLLESNDIDYLAALEGDPLVRRFFPTGVKTREQTQLMISQFIENYAQKGLPFFLLFQLDSHEFLGRAGFGIMKNGEIEIGYALHKTFWGKGYASEAVATLLAWASQHIQANYIFAYAEKDNTPSIKVMEKNGMAFHKVAVEKGVACQFYRFKLRDEKT